MSGFRPVRDELIGIPGLEVSEGVLLARHTRFGLGGAAALFGQTSHLAAFRRALKIVQKWAVPHVVIGSGSNLIVADQGFDGVVLRFTGSRLSREGLRLSVEAGADLQEVVDQSIAFGLRGMETMTGIPGCLGAAIYGNAGAYGNSMQERVEWVYFTDGPALTRFTNEQCQFGYRESIFKKRKDWVIVAAELAFDEGEANLLREKAQGIRAIRDEKYPPTMKCAGSIFKNVFLANLPTQVQAAVPAGVAREGKVPSAWFLEQVGAKGIRKGDIQVAAYHANLIYNLGGGTAADLVYLIAESKNKVRERFGFDLEEEVQYVGFEMAGAER